MVDHVQDFEIDVVYVKWALDKTKKTKSPGLNNINYKLHKIAFEADPECFTLICCNEIKCLGSEHEFKRIRFVPIFKSTPGTTAPIHVSKE